MGQPCFSKGCEQFTTCPHRHRLRRQAVPRHPPRIHALHAGRGRGGGAEPRTLTGSWWPFRPRDAPAASHAPRLPRLSEVRRPTSPPGAARPPATGGGRRAPHPGAPSARRTRRLPAADWFAGLPVASLSHRWLRPRAPAPRGSGKPHKEGGGGPEIVVSPPGFPQTPIRAPLSTRHRHGGNLLAASRLQGTRRRRHIRRIRFPPNRIRSSRSFRRTAPPPCPPCAFAPEGGASVAV